MNPSTVELWLRMFVEHLEKAGWGPGDEPPVARLFAKFVVKRILASECFGHLSMLLPLLRRVESKMPRLLPPVALALFKLADSADFKLSDSADDDVEIDMPLAARNDFVDSALYKQFLLCRNR